MQQRMVLVLICLGLVSLNATGNERSGVDYKDLITSVQQPVRAKMPLQDITTKAKSIAELLENFKKTVLLPNETGLTALHHAVITDVFLLARGDKSGVSQVECVINSYKKTAELPVYDGIKSNFLLYDLLKKKSSAGRTAEGLARFMVNSMVVEFVKRMPDCMSQEMAWKAAHEEVEKKGYCSILNLLETLRKVEELVAEKS